MSQANPPKVSIIIKAWNEEAHIEAAIRSALSGIDVVGGEVILADSVSTDATVEIARKYPVTIVQLKHVGDRRCGAGPQLGYQVARGDYIYILDGDMELDAGFLPAALAALEADSRLAGVAGLVEERSTASYEFRGRKRRNTEGVAGDTRWLDMGGLYRRSALRQVGYLSNRNLHAFEEMELGLRLTDAGWRLRRLPIRSVAHHGYTEGNWLLLKRRWRSRYLDGSGEVLRASLGKPFFIDVAMTQKHLFVGLALWLGMIAGLLLLPLTPWLLLGSGAAVAILVIWRLTRSGSVMDAVFGQVVWQVASIAMVRGFFTAPADPGEPIEHVKLTSIDLPAGQIRP